LSQSYIFEVGEARHFKFRVLTDTQEYPCMHIMILPPKGMCSESRDLYNVVK